MASLNVHVVSPDKTLFEGEAASVQTEGHEARIRPPTEAPGEAVSPPCTDDDAFGIAPQTSPDLGNAEEDGRSHLADRLRDLGATGGEGDGAAR